MERGKARAESFQGAPPCAPTRWYRGRCRFAGVDRAKAREVLQELEVRARSGYVSPYHFAYVHAGLGEVDQAMEMVERAVTERGGPAYGIKGSFLLAPLHQHPRFQALLERMNLG